jgi:hypothetical protein
LVVLLLALSAPSAIAQPVTAPEREVVPGLKTTRIIGGAPCELGGNRVVFANWYYIQPGDLDWRDAAGKSVYVKGNSDLYGAHHIGINAPHGIRIIAEKPRIMGPLERPHRMIRQEGALYMGWTDSDYYESTDAVHWVKKAALRLDTVVGDAFYQVFVDPTAAPAERYKAVWNGQITRAQLDAFRARRPDAWEPRAAVHLG